MAELHDHLWDTLLAQEPADVARRALVRLNDGGSYEIDVLDETYRIDPHARNISRIQSSASGEPNLSICLSSVVYLASAQDVPLTGEWVSPRELPGGLQFFSGPHDLPVGGLIDRFGTDREAFESAAQRLGGRPEQYADAAYSFRVLPRLPVAVLLWVEDDEFPARVSLLVDRTAHRHLPLDALLAALGLVQNALITAASLT